MNEMRKLMEAVANPPQKLTEAPAKIYVYGINQDDKTVSGSIPASFLAQWVTALENRDDDLNEELHNKLQNKASFKFYDAFASALQTYTPSDFKRMRKVLQGKAGVFDQDGVTLVLAPSKEEAQASFKKSGANKHTVKKY